MGDDSDLAREADPVQGTSIMKSTKVQNPRYNKCSAVVEKNCLVAEYRVAYRISGPRTIIIIVANYYRHVHR